MHGSTEDVYSSIFDLLTFVTYTFNFLPFSPYRLMGHCSHQCHLSGHLSIKSANLVKHTKGVNQRIWILGSIFWKKNLVFVIKSGKKLTRVHLLDIEVMLLNSSTWQTLIGWIVLYQTGLLIGGIVYHVVKAKHTCFKEWAPISKIIEQSSRWH